MLVEGSNKARFIQDKKDVPATHFGTTQQYLVAPKLMVVLRVAVMVKVVHRTRDRSWGELQVLVLLSPRHD